MSESLSAPAPATPAGALSNPLYALPLAAAGIELIGSVGKWASASVSGISSDTLGDAASANGLSGGGKGTAIAAIIIITLTIMALRSGGVVPMIRLAINAGIVLLIAIINISDAGTQSVLGTTVKVSVGWGLWMTLLGGLLMVGAAVMQKRNAS